MSGGPGSRKDGLLTRTKFRLAKVLLPLSQTDTLVLDQLQLALPDANLNRIDVPALAVPRLSEDFCPDDPEVIEFPTLVEGIEIEDLTERFTEALETPEIEVFEVALGIPLRDGKSYRDNEESDGEQLGLPHAPEPEENCIHGLRKFECGFCKDRKREEREVASKKIDLFDLVFPILQPPLGEDFDNLVAFPAGKDLYPFQRTGVKFLADHERVLLGDEMGLGKSIQAIVALKLLFRSGRAKSCLIVCPKSVLTDWEKKIWEWAPELNRVTKVTGSRPSRQLLWSTEEYIYIVTYETLRQDMPGSLEGNANGEDIAKTKFDVVILDEIQKVKNPTAAISRAVRKIDSDIRWGLSGTPLENRIEDLISIFAYLKPGLLQSNDNVSRVKKAIKPYLLRRRKKEALPELPEKVHDDIWLELAESQREAYERAKNEGVIELNSKGDSVTITHVLGLITKLKQICNLDPRAQESCKLEYLKEKLEEVIEDGDKALVFSQYPEKTLTHLETELEKFSPLRYHGALTQSARDEMIRAFQEDENHKVLLMSVKAGGTGLTLTAANYVYHYDLWWNPAVASQAEDRTHRIGQDKTVFVDVLLTVNTIEERIQDILRRKRDLFDEVIDNLSDTDLKSLTEEELFGLFDLKSPRARTGRTAENGAKPSSLVSLSPREFENLTAKLYKKIGYTVRLTQAARDGGVDVYAKRTTVTGEDHLAIQCKHYPDRTVGVETVRSLYGVMQAEPNITQGIVITSGSFSRDCQEFSRGKRINLVDREKLIGMCVRYEVPLT